MTGRGLTVVAMLLVTAAPIAAKTYRWVDEQGTVHYTDHPPPKSAAPAPAAPPVPATAPLQTPQRDPTPPREPPPQREESPAASPPAKPPGPMARPAPTQVAPAPSSAPPAPPQAVPAPVRAAPPAGSPERRDDATALARELIELSGMDRSLEHLAEIGRGAVSTWAWRRGNAQRIWPTLMPLLRRDVMAKPATACLARHLEGGHGAELLGWLRSPLGEKIRQLEVEASSPEGHYQYRKFVSRLPDSPIPQARLDAVRSMAERSRIGEQQTELESAMRSAIGKIFSQPSDNEDDESRDRLARDEHNRFWAVTAMLFTYQNLTEPELQNFDRFDRSPAGVWFTNVYWQCLHETVKVTEQRATEALRTTGQASQAAR